MIVTIDTGGTKTLISSFNNSGKMGESVKIPTPGDPKIYVESLKQIINERYSNEDVEVITLAMPGIIKDGVAVWCPNMGEGWFDVPIAKLLKDMLPGVPLLIENDVKLAGLAEARALNPIPTSAMYISVSTGIGTGIITNGKIDNGLRHSESGHIHIEYNGRMREWESFASGHAIVKKYKKFARDITSPRTWNQIADRISRGLLVIIPIIQPDVIIFGGSVGTYFERYSEFLKKHLLAHLPDHINCPTLLKAQHPEQAVVYGCYYYAKDYLADRATK